MEIKDKTIAFGLTSSFYTYEYIIIEMKKIAKIGANIIPIMSKNAYTTDSRYGKAIDFIDKIEDISGREVISEIDNVEKVEADILIVAPCSRK